MSVPSWDLIILLFFAANVVYGLILRRDSLVILIVSTYISYVATIAGGGIIFALLSRFLPKIAASESFVEAVTFFVLIILLNLWGEYVADAFSFGRGGTALLLTALYGVLSAGLIITCLVSFLPQDIQSNLISTSDLLRLLLKFELLWFLVPVLAMIVVGFLGERGRK